MDKHVFRKPVLLAYIVPILFTLGVILLVTYGLSVTDQASQDEGIRLLEESIRRAVITCYAIEGSYPGDIHHLEDTYGVYIDRTRYIVRYSIFASNIMPDIEVVLIE